MGLEYKTRPDLKLILVQLVYLNVSVVFYGKISFVPADSCRPITAFLCRKLPPDYRFQRHCDSESIMARRPEAEKQKFSWRADFYAPKFYTQGIDGSLGYWLYG